MSNIDSITQLMERKGSIRLILCLRTQGTLSKYKLTKITGLHSTTLDKRIETLRKIEIVKVQREEKGRIKKLVNLTEMGDEIAILLMSIFKMIVNKLHNP